MVQVAEVGGTQTAARAAQARMDQRLDDFAEGAVLHHAGREMGLTKGQTARAWNMIKAGLGPQAS